MLNRTSPVTDPLGPDEDLAAACTDSSLYEWVPQAGYVPMVIERAAGSSFYLPGGRRVLDFASQLVVTNLGHSLEPVHSRVYRAGLELTYVTPFAASRPRAELARRIDAITPAHIRKFFFSTSGSEANNDAIRIARTVTGRTHILYSSRSYHGGHGPAAMASGDERRKLMEKDGGNCFPFRSRGGTLRDDLIAFQAAVEALGPEKIAALIIEAVPGGSGVLVPADGYLEELQTTCRRHGILLICDEILTGFGRTGRWFAFEHWNLEPDLLTLGKALSGGAAPIAAVGVSERIAAQLDPLPLGCGHTFSAHPLCCTAASAAIDLYHEWNVIERAAAAGQVLQSALRSIAGSSAPIAQARGIGMLGALQVASPDAAEPARLQRRALDLGVYVLAKGANLLVAPPLVIDRAELDEGLELLRRALAD